MLGTNLRHLRCHCGITQKQIADLLDIDRSTYSYYETGRTKPDVDMIVKLANIYNVSCDDLLGRSVDMKFESVEWLSAEKPGYTILHKSLSLGDLDRGEQDLILLFRQFTEREKKEFFDLAREKMLTRHRGEMS